MTKTSNNKPIYGRNHMGKYSLWIDWETTGADFDSGLTTKKYQGISFGAIIADNETFTEVASIYRELHFDDTKYQWTNGAEKIHGLSREYLKEHGVPREDALADLLAMISDYLGANGKIMIGGHNVWFDIDFTTQLTMDCAGITLDLHHVKLETSALGFITTGVYKSNELFQLFGADAREKHNALDDARQALAVARGIKQLIQIGLDAS